MMIIKIIFFTQCISLFAIHTSNAQYFEKSGFQILPFGEGGQIKMLYDRRQRPQSVYLKGKVHLVINAGGKEGTPGKSNTKPMILSFDAEARKFSELVNLGLAKSDHHYAPDAQAFLLMDNSVPTRLK